MKVLIIEDDDKKLSKINDVLIKNFDEITIVHTSFLKGAFLELKTNNDFDLIFLDFNFPRYKDSNKAEYNAGLEVLSKYSYYYKDNYDKTKIIVTSSENQTNTVNDFFKTNYLTGINIDTSVVCASNTNFSSALIEAILKK